MGAGGHRGTRGGGVGGQTQERWGGGGACLGSTKGPVCGRACWGDGLHCLGQMFPREEGAEGTGEVVGQRRMRGYSKLEKRSWDGGVDPPPPLRVAALPPLPKCVPS